MPSEKSLRHMVLFRFKDDASEEQVSDAGNAFLTLPKVVHVIQDIEWGKVINDSAPYTHCLLVTVRTEEDLQAYGEHPAHIAIGERYGHLVQDAVVLDFWTRE